MESVGLISARPDNITGIVDYTSHTISFSLKKIIIKRGQISFKYLLIAFGLQRWCPPPFEFKPLGKLHIEFGFSKSVPSTKIGFKQFPGSIAGYSGYIPEETWCQYSRILTVNWRFIDVMNRTLFDTFLKFAKFAKLSVMDSTHSSPLFCLDFSTVIGWWAVQLNTTKTPLVWDRSLRAPLASMPYLTTSFRSRAFNEDIRTRIATIPTFCPCVITTRSQYLDEQSKGLKSSHETCKQINYRWTCWWNR